VSFVLGVDPAGDATKSGCTGKAANFIWGLGKKLIQSAMYKVSWNAGNACTGGEIC